MTNSKQLTINAGGKLLSFEQPRVMGILNVTPDSFYAGSRTPDVDEIRQRAQRMADEGADMIDVGAYSSRPGAADVSPQEEMERLRMALPVIRSVCPHIPLSVDTFRADVARMCVEECGADIINDISGGQLDRNMFRTIAHLKVPYILMHMRGTPADMQQFTGYEHLEREVMLYFAQRVRHLHDLGVSDVILDPGFGFAKTLEQNYDLLQHLDDLQVFGLPVLAGLSRKSMVYKLLGITPDEALNGTTALHMAALERGADILRVHDVQAAVQVVALHHALCGHTNS